MAVPLSSKFFPVNTAARGYYIIPIASGQKLQALRKVL
jgi:hypothetical protein